MPVFSARAVAFDILLRVETQSAYASELLHSVRLDELSPADRGLATEIVMGVLRWQSRLDAVIGAESSRSVAKLDREVLVALRMAAYQVMFLSRVPAHAAINESVELVKRARKTSAAPFANAVLRKIAAGGPVARATDDGGTAAELANEFAHPAWLVERWASHFGMERASAICRHNQHIPATCIRVENQRVLLDLEEEGITLAPGALLASARVVTGGDLTQTRAFREGRVFIQDEASQLVAALVGKGSRILDCCAAPGSKTAAIASRNPGAKIVAAELHPHRAELMRRRVQAANVEVVTSDVLQLPQQEGFDRALADVPCSGTGTLARNPEIKWRLKPEALRELHTKQAAILRAAMRQLVPGGRAVYSTCSLEPEENEAVVEEVLRGFEPYLLLDCRDELDRLRDSGELIVECASQLVEGPYLRTLPGVQPCDGFFAAILERAS